MQIDNRSEVFTKAQQHFERFDLSQAQIKPGHWYKLVYIQPKPKVL
jgi:hypothetical protein